MSVWIQSNLATILISLALLAAVALIVRKLVRDHKNGSPVCCGDCCRCAGCPACHKKSSS